MKIQKIISQSRRDFTAEMVCENCNATEINDSGYDDAFYHSKVIPSMKCKSCDKTSDDYYTYSEEEVESILYQYAEDEHGWFSSKSEIESFNNWIKENL